MIRNLITATLLCIVAMNTPPVSGASTPSGQRWTNSLGMVFVPVPSTAVRFSVWETRVKDYRAYARANTNVDASWRSADVTGKGRPVSTNDLDPVVMVNWHDAKAFCTWLTEKETKEGRLPKQQSYRLPTDVEWSMAVGLPREEGARPEERTEKNKEEFPWGKEWPPPGKAGNYADESFRKLDPAFAFFSKLPPEFADGYAVTSPVGSFTANMHGLWDMGGNVEEWCEDWYNDKQTGRTLRGGSFSSGGRRFLLSSFRSDHKPETRFANGGFRVVLAISAEPPK